MKTRRIHVFDPATHRFGAGELLVDGDSLHIDRLAGTADSDLYLSPGFIDTHTHCYYGGAYLGIEPSSIGLRHGVHMLIDAGSAGAANYKGFRDFVAPRYETDVRAFLNISTIGLASGQPYHDMRLCDVQKAVDAVREDNGRFLLGIKVLASYVRVEDSGLEPMKLAVQAARELGLPVMAHLSEGPPYNEETLPLMGKGDIVTHAFHGDKSQYFGNPNLMFDEDGTPCPAMEEALKRGVILDVGHGSASMGASIAQGVVRSGRRDFIISTDLHSGSLPGRVKSLPMTMNKFLTFGMTIDEVVDSVTMIPARALHFDNWGSDLTQTATIFRLRDARADDMPMVDSMDVPIAATQWVEPVAVIHKGKLIDLEKGW